MSLQGLATSGRFFLSLKSKACHLAPLDHSLEEASLVYIGAVKSKMYFQKNGNSEGEGGLTIMEFCGHGGVTHFGISEGKGGLKHGSRPWLGMDIFWNYPML